MAFGDVRKCPLCPAHWIEDNQMYINSDVCPQCGADAGDFTRDKFGNLPQWVDQFWLAEDDYYWELEDDLGVRIELEE